MYINDLGMRDVNNQTGVSEAAGLTAAGQSAESRRAAAVEKFPTTLEEAVERLTADKSGSEAGTMKIEEALEHLKSDPEWEDVGTALTALYENQQKMQTQMNLLSAGYYGGLTGLGLNTSSLLNSSLGAGATLLSAYGGTAGLMGSSIFGDMLL